MVVLLGLYAWRVRVSGTDGLSFLFLVMSFFFLFYVINYWTLVIQLTRERLKLKFGVFTWTVPLGNVEDCALDVVPLLARFGGAGIHFMLIRGRYRVIFNFLEYPRLVLALKKKQGPVRDVVFSTRQPVEIEQLIREAIAHQDR
jgi:uncharacterized membrane protein